MHSQTFEAFVSLLDALRAEYAQLEQSRSEVGLSLNEACTELHKLKENKSA